MGSFRVDGEFHIVARDLQASGEEEGVVEEEVGGADREQARREVMQVCPQRRDGGNTNLLLGPPGEVVGPVGVGPDGIGDLADQ
jgi:hypothetical protein